MKLLTITLLTFCFINLYCKENEKNNFQEWSNYQGEMNWKDAKAKCASLKMSLPRRGELEAAYKAKVTESWKADWEKSADSDYWTSEEYENKANAYFFSVTTGYVGNYEKEGIGNVRCIR